MMKMQDKTNNISDQGVVLMVRNWQTADKYAVCFTREHGKVRFIAYGARYVRNTAGCCSPLPVCSWKLPPDRRLTV